MRGGGGIGGGMAEDSVERAESWSTIVDEAKVAVYIPRGSRVGPGRRSGGTSRSPGQAILTRHDARNGMNEPLERRCPVS